MTTVNTSPDVVTITKDPDSKLSVQVVNTVTKIDLFTIQYLKQQKRDIIADRDAYVATRNRELASVQYLIDEAKLLGVE